ncbi:hypothetical protein P154DRAFT_516552 [Amniculicola lignicola CBS 123094]|uniref:Histone H1 n=1 Tax=Amniculicola lignicola CBS 123094 TaxID=1392246 RepID=A0A6A5X462_9PLEO|nr:hypothetical protein P154DRAFT_516552 [Amniculicola lignicola CBS 123094]
MPPKKSAAAAPKKAAAAAPAHASYQDMIKDAIVNLKERNGSSRQAIQKYIKANNKLGDVTDVMFKSHVNRAIQSGEKSGVFTRPKGTSGPVKLQKKETAPKKEPAAKVEKKAPAATKVKKAPATKAKTTTAKKPVAAPKKIAAKAAPKKAAAKPKANASRPRKTATAAPAVDVQVSRVLGKTKSGRVTKTQAPAPPKKAAVAKKAAPKKASVKKATPKKAEA